MSTFLPDSFKLLKMLGFRFSLDWDGEVEIEAPEFIDVEQLAARVRSEWLEAIQSRLRIESANRMHQCVGGPFSGQPHHKIYPTPVCIKVGPAQWAAYGTRIDGRAIFAGMATSEAKARKLAMQKTQTFERP